MNGAIYRVNQGFKLRERERGLAIVEFALAVPVMLILILITSDYTRAFYQYNALTKSVRDAARHLSQGGVLTAVPQVQASINQRITEAQNIAYSGNIGGGGTPLLPGISASDFTVTTSRIGPGVGRLHVRVQVDYQYVPLLPVIESLGFLPGSVDNSNLILSASSTMRAI